MVCTTLESQRTHCSYPCLFANDAGLSDCAGYGDDLQCLIIETNSPSGFCSEVGQLWIAGIIMSLAGSLLSNLGMLTQKNAYNRGEEEIHEGLEAERDDFVKMDKAKLKNAAMEVGVPESQLTDSKLQDVDAVISLMRDAKRKNPFCMPMWLLGFVGMVTGALLDFGSLIFAAQSLLGACVSVLLITTFATVEWSNKNSYRLPLEMTQVRWQTPQPHRRLLAGCSTTCGFDAGHQHCPGAVRGWGEAKFTRRCVHDCHCSGMHAGGSVRRPQHSHLFTAGDA